MSGQTTTKKNGRTAQPVCRHSPGCEMAIRQDDLSAQVQRYSEAMGEAIGRVEDRLRAISEHLHDVAHGHVVTMQREERWMRELSVISRGLARVMPSVAAELEALRKAEEKVAL